MPLAANILSQIAQPQVANTVGALGQALKQTTESFATSQETQQRAQRFKEVTDQNALIAFTNDINSALSMGPGQAQDDIVKNALTKVPEGSAPYVVGTNILSMPGPEKQTMLKKAVDDGTRAGFLKPEQKAEKTADILERETVAKELQAESGSKTTAIKEFEFSEKNPKFLLDKKEKELTANIREAAGKTFKYSMDLRKEFTAQSADFQKVRDAYTRVKGSTETPSAAGDLSLIFNYMKMLDPGSVVRESEFATAAAAGGYGERIKAAVQKIGTGERLSTKMRADFLSKSGVLMKGIENQHKKREKSYRNIATRNKLDPNEVVIDLTIPQEETQPQGQVLNFDNQGNQIQ